MNEEQLMGFWKNLQAPLKNKWEKLTDDDLLQIDGNMVKFHEVLDLRYGEQKGAVVTWTNRRYSHATGNYDGYEYGIKGPEYTPSE